MKKIVLAVLLTAVIIWVSCNQSPKPKSGNPLVGQWKIDSIATANNNLIGVMLLASTLNDSAAFDVSFTPDSVKLHQKDTITKRSYAFNTNTNQLFINDEDSNVLSYQVLDPTYIKLTAKDSTIIFLKKK